MQGRSARELPRCARAASLRERCISMRRRVAAVLVLCLIHVLGLLVLVYSDRALSLCGERGCSFLWARSATPRQLPRTAAVEERESAQVEQRAHPPTPTQRANTHRLGHLYHLAELTTCARREARTLSALEGARSASRSLPPLSPSALHGWRRVITRGWDLLGRETDREWVPPPLPPPYPPP